MAQINTYKLNLQMQGIIQSFKAGDKTIVIVCLQSKPYCERPHTPSSVAFQPAHVWKKGTKAFGPSQTDSFFPLAVRFLPTLTDCTEPHTNTPIKHTHKLMTAVTCLHYVYYSLAVNQIITSTAVVFTTC